MIYNLSLNSEDYYSSLTGGGVRSHRVYAVDWSFLPNNKKFKVTFKFESRKRSSGAIGSSVNNVRLICDFGRPFLQQYNAGSDVGIKQNNFLGLMVNQRVTSATDQSRFLVLPNDNPPVFLETRPNGSFLTIDLLLNTGSRATLLTGSYLMTLYFEEVDD